MLKRGPAPTRVALLLLLAASTAHAEPGWELRVPERVELVAGAGGTLPVAIAVDRGLTISKDARLILDLAPEGVGVPKKRLGRGDAVDPDADAPRFAVPLHADAAGDFTVRLHVRFWLCGAKACRPIDARRTVAVAVRSS